MRRNAPTWQLEADQAEVAAELGVTKQAVNQVEASALRKARKILEKRGLSLADFCDAMQRGHHSGGADRG